MPSRLRAVLAAAAVVAAVLVLALGLREREREREPVATDAASRSVAANEPSPDADQSRPEPVAERGKADARPVEVADVPAAPRPSQAWQKAKERIADAIERRRTTPLPPARDDAGEPELRTIDKAYIRATVKDEMLPLVKECYDNLLERDPKSGGRMVLQFAIMGDESVGGIVDDVQLAAESEIQDPEFRECLTESTMSAVFDPPEGGGRVEITYPFIFTVEHG